MANPNTSSSKHGNKPEWLQQYDLIGKIGEGTYGLVFLARIKPPSANRGKFIAIKKFKQSKDGDGVSPTAIREIMLLQEISHENVVKLVNVHINHADMSLYLAFDYSQHDLYEIIRYHRDKAGGQPINPYTVKSLLWQLLNGLNYLHSNWIIHRDLKPSNILVMGEGDEQGLVKIADFGLARIYQSPLKPLYENGVVVTIWYRAPELLLGAKHYTSAVDMWAVGCIFAELITLKPLFQGQEVKATQNPFQLDQLDKIFKVLGHPTVDKWPTLANLPHWQTFRTGNKMFSTFKDGNSHETGGIGSFVSLSPKSPAFDLLSKMLEYDPRKRITAAQALEHEYFRNEPLPGRNALVPSTGDRVNYPTRPVDTTTDIEGTTSLQPSQPRAPLFLCAAIIREHSRCSPCYGQQRRSSWAYAHGWNSEDARPWDCRLWPCTAGRDRWRDEPWWHPNAARHFSTGTAAAVEKKRPGTNAWIPSTKIKALLR